MNAHALIPLIATIAYTPLLVILLGNRPWNRKKTLFFLFLISAALWSLSDIFGRSDFFMQDKLLLVRIVLCAGIWMGVQYHYFLTAFYQPQPGKRPFAYVLPLSTVLLATQGYIPRSIDITAGGIHVAYGGWFMLVASALVVLAGKDVYHLARQRRILTDPAERNQIAYLFAGIAVLVIPMFISFAPFGGGYPFAHIGNLLNAATLGYIVVAHKLLDVRVVLQRALTYLALYGSGFGLVVAFLFVAHLLFGFDPDVTTLAVAIGLGVPIVAFLSHKARGIVQTKAEQTFAGDKYHTRKDLSEFVTKIYDVPTLEHFGSQLVALLSESLDCQRASLALPEGGGGDFAARFAYPLTDDNPMANLRFRHDSPIVTWLKRQAKTLTERHVAILPEFQGLWQAEKEDIQSAKVEMLVPMIHMGELVAILAIGSKRYGKLYTVEDIDLMESVVSSVAASMEKEYLHEQLEEQDKELSIINQLTTIVTSSVNIQDIFERFAAELQKVIDLDYAGIALVEGEQTYFTATSGQIKAMDLVAQK